MYDAIRACGPISGIYYVSLFILGNFIVLNLFLAILLDNFSTSKEDKELKSKNPSKTILCLTQFCKIFINPMKKLCDKMNDCKYNHIYQSW